MADKLLTLRKRPNRRIHPASRKKRNVTRTNSVVSVDVVNFPLNSGENNQEEAQVSSSNISSTTSELICDTTSSDLNNEIAEVNTVPIVTSSSNSVTSDSPSVPSEPSNSLNTVIQGDTDISVTTSGKSSSEAVEEEKQTVTETNEHECPICLQNYVFPAKLPCSHVFCYLCIKGVITARGLCPMCRAAIPQNYDINPELIPSTTTPYIEGEVEESNDVWFYEGRHGGWWQFEDRMSEEIEENMNSGITQFELMICGDLYVIDTMSKIQYPKDNPRKVRRLLRGIPAQVNTKGVAGISRLNLPSTSSLTKK